MRAWAPTFRRNAWQRALASHGVDDPEFAQQLAERFREERRKRNVPFADAAEVLPLLARRLRLALVTNGAPDLQHFKVDAAGLRPYFQTVVVTGEVGIGKPDPRPFRVALQRLGCEPARAAMVGNSLRADIAGAQRAGVRAIWLNRDGDADAGDVRPDATINSLRELSDLLL